MDIASLGVAVESSGVQRGTSALNDFANASKKAQAASEGLSSSTRASSSAAVAAARATQAEASAKLAAAKASENASRADIQAAAAAKRLATAAYEAAKAENARQVATAKAAAAAQSDTKASLSHAAALVKEAAALRDVQAATATRGKSLTPIVSPVASPWARPGDNDNLPGLGTKGSNSFNTANIAAQLQDTFVTAQMGMNALQIGLQQGTQLASVLAMMENPIKGLGEAFISLISPVSLATIGFVALLAVGVQMVDWPKVTASALNMLADSLQMIAPYAAAAAAGLALFYAPAIIGGTVQLIALMGRLAVQAAITGAAILAANPAGAFVLGITAAVAAAQIFRDELQSILGFDIVEAAKTGANLVINSFEAAFEDIKFVWEQFPNVIGAAVVGAVNSVISGVNTMVDAASRGIDAIISLANKIPGVNLGSIGSVGNIIEKMDNPYADQLSKAAGGREQRLREIFDQDRIGEIGEAIGSAASTASEKLKELATWITTVDDKKKKKSGRGRHEKTDAEKYSDIVEGAERSIASLKAEQAAVGLSAEAAAKLRYETDLLNQAQQKGITLTAAQKAELSGLAGEMASVESATSKAREALDFAKDTTKGFFSDFRQGIESGKGLWKSFADAAMNALGRIQDRFWDKLIDGMVETGDEKGNVTGVGGWITSLLGGSGGKSGATGSARKASGGDAVSLASSLLGSHERTNRGQINNYLQAGGVNLDAAQQAWCAAFVNSSLKQIGVEGTNSNIANSFQNWGTAVTGSAMRGDVLLQGRGLAANATGGHVGLATGVNRMGSGGLEYQMISGNQANKVTEHWVQASEVMVRRADTASAAVEKMATSATAATDGLGKLGSGLGQVGNALNSATPSSGGGGGLFGWLGSLFGSGSSTSKATGGGVASMRTSTFGRFAKGTENAPAGWAWVGEEGPELRKLRSGDVIRSNSRSRQMVANDRGANSNKPTKVNLTVLVQGGSGDEHIRKLAAQGAQEAIGQYHQGQINGGFGEVQKRYASQKG